MILELTKDQAELVAKWYGQCSYITLSGNPCNRCPAGYKAEVCDDLMRKVKGELESIKDLGTGWRVA